MKKLIFRKLFKEITIFFLGSVLITSLIVWTIQAVNYFDFVTEDGHGLKVYFYYSILNFPKIMFRVFPFVFFVSIFYVLINYEIKNELLIFWINGVSKLEFLNKLLIFSIILLFFHLILGSYIAPYSKLKAREYLKNSNIDFFTSLIKDGKFINITKDLTIFIDKKDNNNNYKDIFLEEVKKKNSRMIYASRGKLVDNKDEKMLRLYQGRVINIDQYKTNIFDFEQINFNLKDLNSKSITVPKIQEIDTKILLNCFLNIEKMQNKFKLFKCEEKLKKEIKIELIQRIYKPIYIPLIVLLSSFLVLFSKNNESYSFKKNIIFILIFFVLVYSEVSVKYSDISISYKILFLLIPFLIFFIFYFLFQKLSKNA